MTPSTPNRHQDPKTQQGSGTIDTGGASVNVESLYHAGSWRSKASPVTKIANESISVAKGATSEASEESNRRASQSVSKGVKGSRKSIPLAAEATRVHATSDASDKSKPPGFISQSEEQLKGVDGANETKEEMKGPEVVENAPLPPDPDVDEDAKCIRAAETQQGRPQSGTWFGWWSRPDGYGSDNEKSKERNKRRKIEMEEASNTPLPGTSEAPTNVDKTKNLFTQTNGSLTSAYTNVTAQWEGTLPEIGPSTNSSRSWFGLWSHAQNQQAAAEAEVQGNNQLDEPHHPPQATVSTEPAAIEESKELHLESKQDIKKVGEKRPKPSGWAFWSAERGKEVASTPGGTQKEVGELAVADTPSQSHPEAAQFNEQREQPPDQPKEPVKRAASLLRPKRGKADKAKGVNDESVCTTPVDSKAQTAAVSQIPTPAGTPPRYDSDVHKADPQGKQPHIKPNHILPSLRDVYPQVPSPGYLERLSTYLAHTLHLQSPLTPPNHPYILQSPPRIKKAIAIGVHGFFPAPLLQRVLGQPTGTSIRFANYAAAAIKTWCQERQPDLKNVEIEKVALEGEGYIADRVTTLWKLLLNWLSHLRQADFILVACHSQGVPVALMLVSKLIKLGCLSSNVKIGVCAMAGISLGPFLEYKSRLFGGTALELFDFCDSSSKVSQAYVQSLNICLRHGVRVTFVGSIDDQLVSLESSLFAPLSHPYVNRAVFIDGRLHAPNFLTHLVVLALKLRNLGVSDHGLLRELSAPLAGSLVGGEGHSRIYDDSAVYRLAIDFALETTAVLPSTMPVALTAASSLLATDKDRTWNTAVARRASLSGYPATLTDANGIRRGSFSVSTSLPGIEPIIAQYEPSQGSANSNPFYLPWAVRGMLEENLVKQEPKMQEEVAVLVKEFEEWRPTSKVLRDVRWRLEGVRSML